MANNPTRIMKIRYVNGTEQSFEFPQQTDPMVVATRIDKVLSQNYLLLALEDKVIIIPRNSILNIEISPAGVPMPDIAFQGVREVS